MHHTHRPRRWEAVGADGIVGMLDVGQGFDPIIG